jgi:large subunit ribosomal protein L5
LNKKKSTYVPRLKLYYRDQVREALRKQLGYKNINQLPALKKIVINIGLGEAVSDPKVLDTVKQDIARITGQAPVNTKAKRPISNFKIRKGLVIGLKTTLRGDRMYEFFDRFVNIAAPRIRDFRGFSRDADVITLVSQNKRCSRRSSMTR